MPPENAPPVKVLYIIGWGRSGSTIVDNILGGTDGFFSAGELSYIWERGLLENRLCGCGRALPECRVWAAVLQEVLGGRVAEAIDPANVMRLQRDKVRVRHTWSLLRQEQGQIANDPLTRYIELQGRLYMTLGKVTGARVIVDSSKRPSDGAILRLMPQITPYYVHLVRDPRAVAYSWQRRKAQLDRDRPTDLTPHSPIDSTLKWTLWNFAAEALRRRIDPARSMLVRYEDFAAQPRATIQRMINLVAENSRPPFETSRSVRLSSNHTVSGNPGRFSSGTVELRRDDEWLMSQSRKDRIIATAFALPLLARYGYRLRP